jgi:hypothetical protein
VVILAPKVNRTYDGEGLCLSTVTGRTLPWQETEGSMPEGRKGGSADERTVQRRRGSSVPRLFELSMRHGDCREEGEREGGQTNGRRSRSKFLKAGVSSSLGGLFLPSQPLLSPKRLPGLVPFPALSPSPPMPFQPAVLPPYFAPSRIRRAALVPKRRGWRGSRGEESGRQWSSS